MQVADVHKHLDAFVENLYLQPDGDTALGKAYWAGGPQLPESAAMDSTPLGRSAMKSLASMRNAVDEMALASQQAQAIARNSKIAAVRAYEALKSNEVIQEREEAAGEGEDPGATPGGPPVPGAQKKGGKKGGKKGAAKKGGGLPAEDGEEETIDPTVYWLNKDLQDAFAMVKKVSIDAQIQANAITKKYQQVRHASRAITEALNYPGAQLPPPIPPVMLKPPRRPRDLSPFWLDVPYGISSGGDPYAVHDGAPRDSAAETVMGVPGFNPFEGTVPMSEAGLVGIYNNIGGTQKGGVAGAASGAVWDKHSLQAGLDLEAGGGGEEDSALGDAAALAGAPKML